MNKSFTLIELLIVVAIIGILALVGFANYFNSFKAARDARRKADLSTIQKALEEYYQDNNSYPPANGGVLPDVEGAFCHPSGDCNTATYLPVIPTEGVGVQYVYESDAGGTYYKLFACIENKNDNGPGVDQDGYAPSCGTDRCDPCRYIVTSTNTTP